MGPLFVSRPHSKPLMPRAGGELQRVSELLLQRIEDGTVIEGHATARLMPRVPRMIRDQQGPVRVSLHGIYRLHRTHRAGGFAVTNNPTRR